MLKLRISLSHISIRWLYSISRHHKDQFVCSKVPKIRIQSLFSFFILFPNWENTLLTVHILVQITKVFAYRRNTTGLLKISWNLLYLLCVGKLIPLILWKDSCNILFWGTWLKFSLQHNLPHDCPHERKDTLCCLFKCLIHLMFVYLTNTSSFCMNYECCYQVQRQESVTSTGEDCGH